MDKGVAIWPNASAHGVLSCASAVVDFVIAIWLFAESRRIRHPALTALSVGFVGLGVIAGTFSVVQTPVHMAAVRAAIVFCLPTFFALTSFFFLCPSAR